MQAQAEGDPTPGAKPIPGGLSVKTLVLQLPQLPNVQLRGHVNSNLQVEFDWFYISHYLGHGKGFWKSYRPLVEQAMMELQVPLDELHIRGDGDEDEGESNKDAQWSTTTVSPRCLLCTLLVIISRKQAGSAMKTKSMKLAQAVLKHPFIQGDLVFTNNVTFIVPHLGQYNQPHQLRLEFNSTGHANLTDLLGLYPPARKRWEPTIVFSACALCIEM